MSATEDTATQATLTDTDFGHLDLNVGDYVKDRDEDVSATMLVVGLSPKTAEDFEIDDDGTTVADVNPDADPEEKVIEVVFPNDHDIDIPDNRYAYPRSRLQLEESIHGR